jgi:hypothetical protein
MQKRIHTFSILPFEKGITPVLSAIPWITDSTTVQNIIIITIVSKGTIACDVKAAVS